MVLGLAQTPMKLGARKIGCGSPCLVVAEIGTSHAGCLPRARQLVDAAWEAGADCVKFQLVLADEIVHPCVGTIDLPGGRIPIYARFEAVERDVDFYREIKAHAESKGLSFLCTPFGVRSARMLRSLGVDAIKIASPELSHYPLLREVAGYGVPLVLSSGVSTPSDIERALSVVGANVVLLHCLTSYPAPEREYNVSVLRNLAATFGVLTGVSDHSSDPVLVPALSAAIGAAIIEKHFALSKEDPGLDDPIALDPACFGRMVSEIRAAETLGWQATVAALKERYGASGIDRIVGDGVKRLAPCEKDNYGTTNRTLVATQRISVGQVVMASKVAVLRSEKNHKPGVSVDHFSVILGRRVRRDIQPGDGIAWDDLV